MVRLAAKEEAESKGVSKIAGRRLRLEVNWRLSEHVISEALAPNIARGQCTSICSISTTSKFPFLVPIVPKGPLLNESELWDDIVAA